MHLLCETICMYDMVDRKSQINTTLNVELGAGRMAHGARHGQKDMILKYMPWNNHSTDRLSLYKIKINFPIPIKLTIYHVVSPKSSLYMYSQYQQKLLSSPHKIS